VILWHLGATLYLFRWIFRDPKVDVRFLALGALLPDVVDMAVGTAVFRSDMATAELWMHTLAAPSAIVVVILIATRRGRRRRAWMALAVGMFFHLLLDGMWMSQETFLWPFFGLDFTPVDVPYWSDVFDRALSDPVRWLLELAGLAYLIVMSRRSGLGDPLARRELFTTGRLIEVTS
jgi:hypothetical protein